MLTKTTNGRRVALACCLLISIYLPLRAQDLEPKFLSNAPKGMHFIFFGYSYSSGNILLDPSLPIEDADAVIHSFSLAYATSFGLFGRLAKFDVILPLSLGDWKGLVKGPHSLKLGFSKGVSTRFGADLATVVLAYQYRFEGR